MLFSFDWVRFSSVVACVKLVSRFMSSGILFVFLFDCSQLNKI